MDVPGVFLKASAVLERQMAAQSTDMWVAYTRNAQQKKPDYRTDTEDGLQTEQLPLCSVRTDQEKLRSARKGKRGETSAKTTLNQTHRSSKIHAFTASQKNRSKMGTTGVRIFRVTTKCELELCAF